MRALNISVYVLCTFVAVIFAAIVHNSTTVYASPTRIGTSCTDEMFAMYQAEARVDDSTLVFAKLGVPKQRLRVEVIEKSKSGCRRVGEKSVSADKWTYIGELKTQKGNVSIGLESQKLAGLLPNANRPSLLLINKSEPICKPQVHCNIEINGENGYLLPQTSLKNEESLYLMRPVDPYNDEISNVQYYLDNDLKYTTTSLENFDMRYALSPRQQITRVVNYTSGQTIVLEDVVPDDYQGSIFNFGYSLLNNRSLLLRAASYLIAILSVVVLMKLILTKLLGAYRWRYAHGLISSKSKSAIIMRRLDLFTDRLRNPVKYTGLLLGIPAFVVVIYALLSTYVLDIYKVNGSSMETRLHNGESMLVNKYSKTLANATGKQISLKRGDIIITNAIYGRVDNEIKNTDRHNIVKRVLGLPGERVKIVKGKIVVYAKDGNVVYEDEKSPWRQYIQDDSSINGVDITLDLNEVFVSGDNRPVSEDSRANGPLQTNLIIGKVIGDW